MVHKRMLAGLHQRGYGDLIAAHLNVLQYPGPENMRPSDLANRTRMTKQALNYLLGQMEGLGYLRR
ncbi:MAG: MarR family transcriptional regulator, partial [Solirubrobacterales bacterium]